MTWLIRLVFLRLPIVVRGLFWRVVCGLMGGRLGPHARVYGGARIVQGSGGATIQIGSHARLLRNSVINTGPKGRITIGKHFHLGENSLVTSKSDVEVGDDVVIGPYSVIIDADHVFGDPQVPIRLQGFKTASVRIEDGVWMASHVNIVKGVTIGKGAVVAAGAMVTHDVPPYSIVAGVPARVISQRPGAPPGERT